jgi:hypothetical protein
MLALSWKFVVLYLLCTTVSRCLLNLCTRCYASLDGSCVCVSRYMSVLYTHKNLLVFCRSLFDLLAFSFWLLCCLSFDARVLITPFGISKLLLIMTYKSCEEQSVVKHKYKYNFLIMKM